MITGPYQVQPTLWVAPARLAYANLRGTSAALESDFFFNHVLTNATDDHKYSPFPSQILTVPEFWYHLLHSFWRKKVPLDFEKAL